MLYESHCDSDTIKEFTERIGILEQEVQEDIMTNMKKDNLLTKFEISSSTEKKINELTTTINNFISDTIQSTQSLDKNNQVLSSTSDSKKKMTEKQKKKKIRKK